MKKENLQKSIVLLGPSCVGKSLLSAQLGEDLGLPVVSVDDVFAMAEYDLDEHLSKDPASQKKFVKLCVKELKDTTMAWTLKDSKHSKVLAMQMKNIISMYNRYYNLLGGYKQVQQFLPDHEAISRMGLVENICYYNYLTLKVLKMILKNLDRPVVLDVPGFLGWEASLETIPPRALKNFQEKYMDIQQMQQDIASILSFAQTVLLEPGRDYYTRNASKQSPTNNLILRYFENYYPNAKVQVSTNDLFNNPENKFFQQRRYIDAREAVIKEELKNKCEINNICCQIIEMLQELSDQKAMEEKQCSAK